MRNEPKRPLVTFRFVKFIDRKQKNNFVIALAQQKVANNIISILKPPKLSSVFQKIEIG